MSNVTINIQEHEQTGNAMFWSGEPISATRSLAMRAGWEQGRSDFENEQRAEREMWAAKAEQMAVIRKW